MTDIVSIGFQVDTSQIATGTKRMEKFGSTAQKTEGKVTQSVGSMGRSFGQAGIQIQQFVGQVQGGISPMVAMSQQAADLGIVLGAPLLGVLASFAASIGLVVAPALFDADDAADKLKNTLEALDKVVTQTAGGTYTLSAEIARLAKVSETAANAQIALSITEATQAINLARDSADEAIESFDDLFNGFDVVSTPETLNKLNEAMQRTGLSAAELLNSSNLYATGLTQIKSFSDSLSDSLGTTTEDSIKLIQAVSDFRQGGSVSQLAETFSTISLSTNGATKEFQALAVNLNNLSLTTEKSEAVLDLLKSTLGDLTGILEHSDSVVNDIINSYKMKTDALSADETQMAKNIALQTIGTNATQEEKDAVLQAVDAYYEKLNAIKEEANAQKRSADEAKKKAKAELDAAKSYQDQINALKSLAEQLVLTADEQMVYQQIQKSLARGDTPEQTAEIERQTRAYIEQRNALKLASDSKNDYDKWIESISTTSTRMAELRAEIEKTQAAVDSGDLSSSVASEYIADLQAQIKSLEVNPFQSMTDGAQDALQAMSGMFESGSKDAKKLAIAMEALNLVQAVGAVLNQGSGDPYTAFGRMAAMAAMVASLGISIGNLSGSFADESAARQESQNLNSWGEHATSIADATEQTANATKKLVGINTDMLEALQNLTVALASASSIIAKNINIPTVSASVYSFGSIDLINGVIPGLVKSLDIFSSFSQLIPNIVSSFDIVGNAIGSWLGGKSKVTDEGIRILGGSLSDLMEDITIQAFQSIKYKKWRFGSTKRKTSFVNLGDEVSAQFSLVFESIADSVATGAEILGFSADDISAALDAFVVKTTSLSLKDLSASKQAEVIENYFSSVFNSVAAAVVPFLRDFQQVGEELGTTLSRLATEVSVAEYLIDNLGVTFADKFTDQEAFITAADNLATLAGGVEELADQVSSFTDAFATDTQKFQIYQEAMKSALEDVGLSLPSSAAGFYELMSSLDATTEAGQQQIATLLGLTDTASAYYDLLDDTAGKFRDAAEALYDISYAAAQVSLDSALAAARLGDFSLAEALDLNSIGPSTSDFSSALEYNLARAETAAKLNELATLQEGSATIDEKQLTVLEEIRDSLNSRDTITSSDSTSSQLVEQIAALKSEFKTLSNQITYGVLTVRQETTA